MDWKDRCVGWSHDAHNIKGFFGEYRWLSNFHECEVQYEGLVFNSSEAAYQAAKTTDITARMTFLLLSPSRAKNHGRNIVLRSDWEDIKMHIMQDVLRDKFVRNADLNLALINTGDKYLEETNWWSDRYWGVYNGAGENHLGKLLMKIRTSMQ